MIESVHNKLKNSCQIDHHRHRSRFNFLVNLISGIIAYCYDPCRPNIYKNKDKKIIINKSELLQNWFLLLKLALTKLWLFLSKNYLLIFCDNIFRETRVIYVSCFFKLLYSKHIFTKKLNFSIAKKNSGCKIRTYDQWINSPLLYRWANPEYLFIMNQFTNTSNI